MFTDPTVLQYRFICHVSKYGRLYQIQYYAINIIVETYNQMCNSFCMSLLVKKGSSTGFDIYKLQCKMKRLWTNKNKKCTYFFFRIIKLSKNEFL